MFDPLLSKQIITVSVSSKEEIPAGRHVIEFRSIDTDPNIVVNSQPFSIRIENSIGIIDETKSNGAFPYQVFTLDNPITIETFRFS